MKKTFLLLFSLLAALFLLPGGTASWGDSLLIEGLVRTGGRSIEQGDTESNSADPVPGEETENDQPSNLQEETEPPDIEAPRPENEPEEKMTDEKQPVETEEEPDNLPEESGNKMLDSEPAAENQLSDHSS